MILPSVDGACSTGYFVVLVPVLAGASLKAELILIIVELSLQRSTSHLLLAGAVGLNVFGIPVARRCRLARLRT